MNVDEIKNHFEIAMSCEFDTQRVHDPKEHIRICCELSDDCNIFIGKTYDMIDLSCIDPLERKTKYLYLYNTTSDTIAIQLISTTTSKSYYNITEVSSLTLTEEGFFQQSLIREIGVNYDELNVLVDCFEKLSTFVLSLFNIQSQNPMVVKC